MRITMRVVYIMLHVYYMAHLNKLNKSIKSKRLPCSGDIIYFQRRNANYVDLAPIHGYISGPSTVICLHYKSYRAEPRPSGPSPPPLGGPGPHDIWVGRARSDAFTLHQTGLGTVPSPVKLYSVNGAIETMKGAKSQDKSGRPTKVTEDSEVSLSLTHTVSLTSEWQCHGPVVNDPAGQCCNAVFRWQHNFQLHSASPEIVVNLEIQ